MIMGRFNLYFFFLMIVTVSCVAPVKQDDTEYLGLPGDNLNLYAVLNLFQESKTLESFEKSLNDKDAKINNLDLNNDDQIDYIRVEDIAEGNLHNIVLKVDLDESEQQDVAVFILESNGADEVTIQLIGDEGLYGKDYIVEPNYPEELASGETLNPGYTKTSSTTTQDENGNTITVNNYTTQETANWTLVRFIFAPDYVVWRSPWYWNYYPGYWNPWRPWYWHQYYGYHSHWHHHYHGHYHRPSFYRNPIARKTYRNKYHKSSLSYSKNINKGVYKRTYSKPETKNIGTKIYKKHYPNKVNPKLPNKSIKPPVKPRPSLKRPAVKTPPKAKNPSVKRPANSNQKPKPNYQHPRTKKSGTTTRPKGTSTKTKPSIQKQSPKLPRSGKKTSRSKSNGIK